MTSQSGDIFARGCAALEAEDLEGVRSAIAAVSKVGIDENDPRLGYLEFMASWLDDPSEAGEFDEWVGKAGDLLERAGELRDAAEAARIVLDVADILIELGEVDDAEHALRSLTERADLGPQSDGEARILRAQVLLDYHEDPEEALAILDGVDASMREDVGYLSLRAAVLLDLDRDSEAISLLEREVARTSDVELRYQLGMVLRGAGRHDEALAQLLVVREQDIATHDVDVDARIPADEVSDLRRQLEDVLETLPEPVLERLATASIRVERWPSEAAVRAGCDPRTSLAFEGQPAGEDSDGKVDAIVIYRDSIIAQIDVDDEIVDQLALSLVDETDRFFDLELFPGV